MKLAVVGATGMVEIDAATLSDIFVIGEGLGSDNTNILTFGENRDTIDIVTITYY